MGLGVLEYRLMATPPGTTTLDATTTTESSAADTAGLKRDGDIILQPQPSDSPNDPLNWSAVRKEVIMVILAFSSGVTTALGPMVTPGLPLIAEKYNVSIDMVASLVIGFLAFWIGFTTFFTAAGANIWGKRPFFLVSTVVLLATNVWGYFTKSFVSLAVMRVVQGIASAPLETLVTSSVSDMYFIHQRGTRISIWGCMLASGVLLGQTIAGAIIQNISFEATFGISALIFIPILLGMYFFVVETTYNGARPSSKAGPKPVGEEKSSSWSECGEEMESYRKQLTIISSSRSESKPAGEERSESWSDCLVEKETYRKQLTIFRGRLSSESFWQNVWKPIPLIAYPAVLFSTVVYGTYFTWLLTISVLSVTIFSAPPYSLGPAQVGLTNLPLLLVALIGSPLSGWAGDFIAKFMARRNKGIFEPEFRLTLMLPAAILATVGFLGFGISAQRGASIYQLVAFMAIHAFSVPFASTASLTYVIDCHPRDANQAFVTINFTKAVLTFVATTYANGVMEQLGPSKVFIAITIINVCICALTIPAYVFGKRFRGLVARSSFGQKLSG